MHRSDIERLSRGDFRRYFMRRYFRLLFAALDPKQATARYGDPKVVERIAEGFEWLRTPELPATSPVPKKLWLLWQQGWDSAPPVVTACARSWSEQNPDWEINFLKDDQLEELAPGYAEHAPHIATPQGKSNLARLCLLRSYGGVWADATLFCARPLDSWLPAVTRSGLFMFSRPRPYRFYDIWFMASIPGNPVISKWIEIAGRYSRLFEGTHHYYWTEYLYEMLAERDRQTMKAWEEMTKVSALGPLAVQAVAFRQDAPKETFDLIADRLVPVHKLSHKWPQSETLEGTPVGALTGLASI